MVAGVNRSGDRIEIVIPCKREYVRTVRKAVAEFAALKNMPRCDVEEVEVAASEAVSNVVRHAYDGDDKLPPVRIKCSLGKDGLMVEVADKGKGFHAPPDDAQHEVDFDREGGMGLTLMRKLMDRVNLVSKPDAGTRIRMTKRLRSAIAQTSAAEREARARK